MINEFDIRDWEHVDFKALDESIESVDDCCRMGPCLPYGAINHLKAFVKNMELLRDKQIQLATKHIAAVEKKGFHG